MRKEERFCESCGYYNGEKDNSGWDDNYDDHNLFDDYEVEEKEEGNEEFEEFNLKDSSGTKKNEFSYENEDLLEAFIGEDYKPIKKIPFNIFAFLLNWSYLLYRKLYITGILGLVVTGIIILFFPSILKSIEYEFPRVLS